MLLFGGALGGKSALFQLVVMVGVRKLLDFVFTNFVGPIRLFTSLSATSSVRINAESPYKPDPYSAHIV